MFQRTPTIHPQASTVLGRVKSLDTAGHESNALGAKTFRGLAYNPGGPQRRVVVTKNVPATGGWIAPGRATGGKAPQRTFSR
jgi:hypothetical protein